MRVLKCHPKKSGVTQQRKVLKMSQDDSGVHSDSCKEDSLVEEEVVEKKERRESKEETKMINACLRQRGR